MRNTAVRIAMWASAGFVIAVGWGVYFTYADKAKPIGPIIYTLSRLTVPLIGVADYSHFDFPIGVRATVVANAVTYALIGLMLAMIRRHYRPIRISN